MKDTLSFEVQESPVLYSVDGKILTSNSHKVISRSDNNSSIVEVISQTPNRMFSRIKDENSDWEVMTDRLSRIENEFATKFIESQKDIDPEIAQFVSDNFWELL